MTAPGGNETDEGVLPFSGPTCVAILKMISIILRTATFFVVNDIGKISSAGLFGEESLRKLKDMVYLWSKFGILA